jgi:glycosyltransferase involved in cell wall biosynthesis
MTSVGSPRVVIGLEGAQMPANAIRGIGRWAQLYTLWLIDKFPGTVAAVSIDGRLPIPAVVNSLPLDLPVLVSGEPPPRVEGPIVFHPMSILEDLDLATLWPTWARDPSVGLTATVYDMIPALYPGDYFQGAMRYMLDSRYEMVTHAGSVVTISLATARDVQRLISVEGDAIFVAPVLVAPSFAPYPGGRSAAHRMIPGSWGLEPDFVLSIGNVDPRKNLAGLVRAYACLPSRHRARHQLVLTCSQAASGHLATLRRLAEELGVGDRIVLTSFVDDATMVLLYQACHVMVFPSTYEGLGIPVAEAMRCGAATIVSDIPPMRELVTNSEARFNPFDIPEMGRVLRRALDDPAFTELRRTQGVVDSARLARQSSSGTVLGAYKRAASLCP